MTKYLIANDTTLPIISDASPELLAALTDLMGGTNWAKAGKMLNQADRRNLLILRDNLTEIISI